MKKLLLILLCLPSLINAQWNNVGSLPSINSSFANYFYEGHYLDFEIDNNGNMYTIHPDYDASSQVITNNENESQNIYMYAQNNNTWVDIGDSAQSLAISNNELYKAHITNIWETIIGSPTNTGVLLEVKKYNGVNWDPIFKDSIKTELYGNLMNINKNWIMAIEDFIIQNNNYYISFSELYDTLSPNWGPNIAEIVVYKYNSNMNILEKLPYTNVTKYSLAVYAGGNENELKQRYINTELEIDPATGNLLLAGQTHWKTGNWVYGNNIVRSFNGTNWVNFGDTLLNSNQYPSHASSIYMSSKNGHLVIAITQDESVGNDPYSSDTLMLYKYNYANNNWQEFTGGHPQINLYYVNSFSLAVTSNGEPVFACSSYDNILGSDVVMKHNNTTNTWEYIDSPITPPNSSLSFSWQEPMIKIDDNNCIFINYIDIHSDMDFEIITQCMPLYTTNFNNETNKILLKVTDLLGREIKKTNQLLFYIYDDGTVEKRIVIE